LLDDPTEGRLVRRRGVRLAGPPVREVRLRCAPKSRPRLPRYGGAAIRGAPRYSPHGVCRCRQARE
jgi:hypothetical protein